MVNNSKFLFLIFAIFIFFSCNNESKTINVYSHQIKDSIQQKTILDQYLKNQSGLIDAEYYISYQDNSTGFLAAPSDYYLKLALKVIPDSIDNWINDLSLSNSEFPINNWNDLLLDSLKWKITSEGKLYQSDSHSETKVVFRKDSIILAEYFSH